MRWSDSDLNINLQLELESMDKEIIDRAMVIPGMMWPTELHALAKLFEHSVKHVEIGSFCGKSLYATAAGMRKNKGAEIWAVDNFSLTSFTPSRDWCISVLKSTIVSIEGSLNVKTHILSGDSREELRKLRDMQIDSAFVDANHTYEDVCRDVYAVWPMLRVGGILAGHDYADNFIAVKEAVHGIFEANVAILPTTRIWSVRKTPETDLQVQRSIERS